MKPITTITPTYLATITVTRGAMRPRIGMSVGAYVAAGGPSRYLRTIA